MYTLRLVFHLLLYLTLSNTCWADFNKKKKKNNPPTQQEIFDAEKYFIDGMREYLQYNFNKALDFFYKADELHPNQSGIAYAIAQTHFKNGDLVKAENFARKALQLNENEKHNYLLLTEILNKQGKFSESIKIYQQLIKKVPKTDTYYYNLAEAQIYERKYEDAIKTLDKIEQIYGKSEEISKQKQKLYMFLNKTEEAINEAKSLVEANPNITQYKTSLAELLLSLNKKNEAFLTLEKAAKENPDDPYVNLLLFDYYKSNGETTKALEYIRKAFEKQLSIDNKISILLSLMNEISKSNLTKEIVIELSKKVVEQHPHDPKAYSILGDIYLFSKEPNKAIESYKKAIALEPSNYKVWQATISLLAELNQIDTLVFYTEKAIEIFPNDVMFWYFHGTGKFLKKDYKGAAESLEQGKKLSSKDEKLLIQFYSQLGDVYFYLNDYKKSDESYKEVLKRDSNNAHVLNNYSYFLSLRKENLDLAERLSTKLITIYPHEPTYLDTYAWVLYSMKNFKKSEEILSQIVNKTNNATILEHYGDVLYQLGKIDMALEYWKKALSGEGDYSDFLRKKITDKKLYE